MHSIISVSKNDLLVLHLMVIASAFIGYLGYKTGNVAQKFLVSFPCYYNVF